MVVFKTKVFHFKIENTPIKDTNGKRTDENVQNNAQFPFCGQTRAFRSEIVFEGSDLVFYTADRSAWLVLNQPRQRGF